MNIELDSDRLPLRGIFKLVFIGWSIGVLVLFAVPMALGLVAALVSAESERGTALLAALVLPIIAFAQGIMAGGLVCLGLAVYRRKRPIVVSSRRPIDARSN